MDYSSLTEMYRQLPVKDSASAVKQAISFQSDAVIKTCARGHSEHNETASPIIPET